MNKQRAFRPTVGDQLETRCVLSFFGGSNLGPFVSQSFASPFGGPASSSGTQLAGSSFFNGSFNSNFGGFNPGASNGLAFNGGLGTPGASFNGGNTGLSPLGTVLNGASSGLAFNGGLGVATPFNSRGGLLNPFAGRATSGLTFNHGLGLSTGSSNPGVAFGSTTGLLFNHGLGTPGGTSNGVTNGLGFTNGLAFNPRTAASANGLGTPFGNTNRFGTNPGFTNFNPLSNVNLAISNPNPLGGNNGLLGNFNNSGISFI